MEPYVTTLALFDAREGRKLTEDFHLDINHSVVSGMLAEPEGTFENILGDLLPGPLRPRQVCAGLLKYKAIDTRLSCRQDPSVLTLQK